MIEYLCIGFCVLHFVFSMIANIVNAVKNKKRFNELCTKCFMPVYDDEVHQCLDSSQLDLLVKFVDSIKKG